MSCSVVVIGSGATGTGTARDFAMCGFDTTLVEQRNLTEGTTGRTHGHLHSRARYAVSGKESVVDCMQENRVLHRIADHCIEDTGELFVQLEDDSDDYFERKLAGYAECDIPTGVISDEETRRREPYFTDAVERAIWVPDGAVDLFRLCVANAASTVEHGARIETHAEAIGLVVEGGRVADAGVKRQGPNHYSEGVAGDTETFEADYVISATGAWAGQLAAMAGVDLKMVISKGVMVVTNARQLDTVISRCLPKGEGDTTIPHKTTVLLDANDDPVDDPDDYPEEQWEVDMMIGIVSKMVPVVADARMIRAYWGVRPLYDPNLKSMTDLDDVMRNYFVLDHAERDGVARLTSVVGGKLITYREMVESVSDHVCKVLGVEEPCRTDEVSLPGSADPSALDEYMDESDLRSPIARRSGQRLGDRAPEVLDTDKPNPTFYEYEAVTRAEVGDAINQVGADLNGARLRTCASMGNCQGDFCSHRLGAELYPDHGAKVARGAVDELYQGRWKGQRHALRSEQLSQAMLNAMLYATTMNHDTNHVVGGESIEYRVFDGGRTAVPRGSHGD